MIPITDWKEPFSTILGHRSLRSTTSTGCDSSRLSITGQQRSNNSLTTPSTADLTTMSEISDEQQQRSNRSLRDQRSEVGGSEIYKTRSKEIKSVRVELDYTKPINEQAPQNRILRELGDEVEGGHQRKPRHLAFERSNSAIDALGADRRDSFNKGTTTINSDGGNTTNGKKKKKKNPFNKVGKMSQRTKKILAESNFSDDQANQSGSSSQFNFLLATMLTGISYYYILSLFAIVFWSCVCSWYMEELKVMADEGNTNAKKWVTWLDETDVRMIGSLFVFSLVFRFNQCYNRWWQGRMLWGEIIQNCLDFSRKSTLWCMDTVLSDRINRYIVCFPYAAKAQLRGLSLTDETESGQTLVDRGFLAEEELDFLKENPCWEPEFFLDLMRATVAKIILAQWEREPDEQVLLLPHSNRIHDRLFPPWDKAIYDLGKSIGEGVSVRSAGLPRSYDTVHYVFFWIYFLLAPPAEAATIGWMGPIIVGFSACIIMTLMDMGTAMVDPFGTDLVDLPVERFCETIEAQVLTIQRRHATGKIMEFASHATPGTRFHGGGTMDESARTKSATQISLSH